ncbi:MAG: hypothetical protein WC444_05615 [Candidatus Paceibacterota bacterium]
MKNGTIVEDRKLTQKERFDLQLLESIRSISPNCIGIAKGTKITEGKDTGMPAYKLFVKKKLPIEKIPTGEMLPKVLGTQDERLPTDVQELGEIYITSMLKTKRSNKQKIKNIIQRIQGISRTDKARPFKMGTSGGCWDTTALTNGMTFKHIESGKKVIFTNGHGSGCDLRDEMPLSTEKRYLQPGPVDGGQQEGNVVGERLNLVRYKDGKGWNDGMTVMVSSEDYLDEELYELGRVVGVDTLVVGDKVFKSGRTTGKTEGNCTSLNATISVNYGNYSITHLGCILFTGMSAGGDSGSVIVKIREGKIYVVAYLFAGNESVTVAHEIQNMMSIFGLALTQTEEPNDPMENTYTMNVEMEKETNETPQTWTVKGVITDKTTKQPINGVNVKIGEINCNTGLDGSYAVKGLIKGTYNTLFSMSGYKQINGSIVLGG